MNPVQVEELGLKGRLIEIKNRQYNEIDRLIFDKRKEFKTWDERYKAIKHVFVKIQQEMVSEIENFLDKEGGKNV